MSAEAEAVKGLMKELQETNQKQMTALMDTFLAKLQSMEKEKPKDSDTTHKEVKKDVFDEKFVKGFKSFDGKQESWKHWILKFKNRIRMKSKETHALLEKIEQPKVSTLGCQPDQVM